MEMEKNYLAGSGPRQKESLNFGWLFWHGSDTERREEVLWGEGRPVTLPHDWSMEYPFREDAPCKGSGGYAETGVGWYKKTFIVEKTALEGNRHVTLRFDGAYMLTKVWLNGTYLGRHVYGYTPFEWDVTALLKSGEENELIVRVDNSAQPNSRWYSGSGITRSVWLIGTESVHIAPYGVWVKAEGVLEKKVHLAAETRVKLEAAADEEERQVCVETEVYGPDGVLAAASKTREELLFAGTAGSEQIFCQNIEIPEPVLWDTKNPALYEVVTKLWVNGKLYDEVHTMTGIRSVQFTSDQGFLLNGVRTKLNGVCVHHDGGCVGAAVPWRIWERRLKKFQEMGVNAIRMSHNPPDPALLDLCDRMGFLVMDESFDEWRILKGKELGSNTHESRGYSEWFDQCHEEDLRAMLLRDRNHPSIVIWSIGNEVPDQTVEDGVSTARRLKAICRELDDQREVTQANDQLCAEPHPAREDFLAELDVVGYNYTGRWRTRAETLYGDDKIAHPDWKVIGTENPGMGSIRGQYEMEISEKEGWWRRPYFSAPVEVGRLLRYTMTHDFVAGDFMWTGVDYIGEAHWPARSAGAGVLDTCGFEKDGYYFYQSIWNREKPMAHLLPHWNLDVEQGAIVQVLGYTNCEYGELILNGKSYGRKAYSYPAYGMTQEYGHFDKTPIPACTDNLFLSWDVPYEPGVIELVGYQDGKEVVRDIVRTAGEPAKMVVSAYDAQPLADGQDVHQIEVALVDKDGVFCQLGDTALHFSVEGPGEILGVDSGDPTIHEPMKKTGTTAFAGRALAVIRSTGEAGDVKVRVTADGLPAEEITVAFR